MNAHMSESHHSIIVKPSWFMSGEGAILLASAIWLYALHGGNWLLFAALLFAPDLSALGYLVNTRIGATAYNIAHAVILPALLIMAGLLTGNALIISLALIWFAHLGMDRLVGYGFKDPLAPIKPAKARK